MIAADRHRPLGQDAWDESAVRAVINEIAADAIAWDLRWTSSFPYSNDARYPR